MVPGPGRVRVYREIYLEEMRKAAVVTRLARAGAVRLSPFPPFCSNPNFERFFSCVSFASRLISRLSMRPMVIA